MKFILALGVVLTVSVALSNAQCEQGKPTFDLKSRTAVCKYNGKAHKVGEEWTENCMMCSCSKDGFQCCSKAYRPVFDEEECESVFDENACSYIVTKKNNPDETCEIKAMVG
ncbi:beta-microseminoprotein-like [Pseudophryne corroboree]|uniref:beta-microseminoprotein-like n=1 Tax=Pseudophryne corroboree TaxID=495146 RepID=UPI003081A46E